MALEELNQRLNFTGNAYEIISVNENNVERWQDVRVEILNNIINDKEINLSLKGNDSAFITTQNRLYSRYFK